MKITMLAASAAAAATVALSSSIAFAGGPSYTPNWRPHGAQASKGIRPAPRYHRDHYTYRPVYRPAPRPVYRPGPVEISAANLAALKRDIYADGRVTFFEKIKLSNAERRHAALVRSVYR